MSDWDGAKTAESGARTLLVYRPPFGVKEHTSKEYGVSEINMGRKKSGVWHYGWRRDLFSTWRS